MTDNQTSVQQVDLDLDSLFSGAPVADSVMTPSEPTEIKSNVFSKNNTDLGFLDNKDEKKTEDEDDKKTPKDPEELASELVILGSFARRVELRRFLLYYFCSA